jgi:hypothetical protein
MVGAFIQKQEAQPDHLKYKGKKPRYDKGEMDNSTNSNKA